MIIDEGDAGRKKASQEAIEGSVMELAAYGAETVIRIVAPLAVAVQITQGKGVLDGFYVITEAPDFTLEPVPFQKLRTLMPRHTRPATKTSVKRPSMSQYGTIW